MTTLKEHEQAATDIAAYAVAEMVKGYLGIYPNAHISILHDVALVTIAYLSDTDPLTQPANKLVLEASIKALNIEMKIPEDQWPGYSERITYMAEDVGQRVNTYTKERTPPMPERTAELLAQDARFVRLFKEGSKSIYPEATPDQLRVLAEAALESVTPKPPFDPVAGMYRFMKAAKILQTELKLSEAECRTTSGMLIRVMTDTMREIRGNFPGMMPTMH